MINNLQLALILWSFGIGWIVGIVMGQIEGIKQTLNNLKELIKNDE